MYAFSSIGLVGIVAWRTNFFTNDSGYKTFEIILVWAYAQPTLCVSFERLVSFESTSKYCAVMKRRTLSSKRRYGRQRSSIQANVVLAMDSRSPFGVFFRPSSLPPPILTWTPGNQHWIRFVSPFKPIFSRSFWLSLGMFHSVGFMCARRSSSPKAWKAFSNSAAGKG